MLEICRYLFEQWNKDVRYCHWKSNEHLYEGLIGQTDLDVFVLPEDRGLAENCLTNSSYIKVIPQRGCRYPNVDEWIGFDSSTGKLVHIHLHFQIITGRKYNKEYIFPINNLVIDSRVLNTTYNVYTIDPTLEIIVLYSRIVLKAGNKKNIRPDNDVLKEIDYLRQRIDTDRLYNLCSSFFDNNSEVFIRAIQKASLNNIEWYALYIVVEKWLKPFKKYSSFKSYLIYYYHKIRIKVQLFLNNRYAFNYINKKTVHKGFSVCFIGQDGCGKSTNTITMKKWLNWKIEAERFYLGSGDHYNGVLKKFILKSRKKNSRNNNKKGIKPLNNNKSRTFKKWLGYFLIAYNFFLVAKHSYKTIKKANKYISKGGIALFDRFPQNQVVGFYDGPKIAALCYDYNSSIIVRMLANREEYFIRKSQSFQPNLLFKLLLSPEESLRRKPEEDIEVIKKKAFATKKLTFKGSRTIEISAEQPFETELIEIKNHIWNYLLDNDN